MMPTLDGVLQRRVASALCAGAAFVLGCLLLAAPRPAAAQSAAYTFDDAPIREVIARVEATTPYRFLYRDALVSRRTVTFSASPETLLQAFDQALRPHGLHLQVDAGRSQVLLTTRSDDARPRAEVAGTVLDAATGARLPFATVTWREAGQLRGTAADEAGAFRLAMPPGRDALRLTVSYVGYEAAEVRVEAGDAHGTLPVRLQPQALMGREIVVSSSALHTELDTVWHRFLSPRLASSLGESNVLRALQALPAVAVTPALQEGLTVRGSRSDGFQVLLDGATIYNQSHFFGLFDAFNADALQAVGLYYGIAPATYAAPPGGTLSFVTRTGSQTQPAARLGVTNTTVQGTAEGPLFGGRGSWLVSGRHSYLEAVDWFNNTALVAQGLDVGRPSGLGLLRRNRATDPDTDARFFDVHGKLYLEARAGARQSASVYVGADRMALGSDALAPLDTTAAGLRRRVETSDTWGNGAVSLRDVRPLSERRLLQTTLAGSHYHSRYRRDDFLYLRSVTPGALTPLTAPFVHDGDLWEAKLEQQLTAASRRIDWSAGYLAQLVHTTYEEVSALRPLFDADLRGVQLDLFGQLAAAPARSVRVEAGLRSHYASAGAFVRLSPRLLVQLWPAAPVTASLGYSRNHQFLHRLSLAHDRSSDVWILSGEDEPPTSVDHLTAGIALRPGRGVHVQLDGYAKRYRNVRQHTNQLLPRYVPDTSFLMRPWLTDTQARSAGLEVLLRHRLGGLLWMHGYTLSSTELSNDRIADGAWVRAEDDRRHQTTHQVQAALGPAVTLHAAWMLATGAPNALAGTALDEPDQLGPYHRLDVSASVRRRLGGAVVSARVGVFNVYDRQNPWYRSLEPVLTARPPQRVRFVPTDVYDLGRQPSFEVKVAF